MAVRLKIEEKHKDFVKEMAKNLTFTEKTYVKRREGPKIVKAYVDDGMWFYMPMIYASEVYGQKHMNATHPKRNVGSFDTSIVLRDYQEEAVSYARAQLKEKGSVFLNVFCSYGKTIVASYLSYLMSVKNGIMTMVVYPTVGIGNSWYGAFKEHTTAKIHVVGTGDIPPDTQVLLCMPGRILSIPEEVRLNIGHLVIDEADCFCTEIRMQALLHTVPYYITALTATYERDDGFHVCLDALVGTEKLTKISKKEFGVVKIRTDFTAEAKIVGGKMVFGDLVSKLDIIPERNQLICDIVLKNLSHKIAILTLHKNHASLLLSLLEPELKKHGKTVAIYMGKAKTYVDATVLIATYAKGGRGFDQKDGCIAWDGIRIDMCILASSTKKIEQPAGRCLRADFPIVYDIVDDHPVSYRHWAIRKSWYYSRNGRVHDSSGAESWEDITRQAKEQEAKMLEELYH